MAITTKDVWKKLEGVEGGAFHVQISWCDVKISPPDHLAPPLSVFSAAKKEVFVPSSSLTLNRGVLSVCIDSCFNLMGGHFNLSGQLLNHRTYVRGDLGGKVQATDLAVVAGETVVFEKKMNFIVKVRY